MTNNSCDIIQQIRQLRTLFAEAAPQDTKIINDYAWLLVKALNRELDQLGDRECRLLLADYLKLPTVRPSTLHSAILSAAVKVASRYSEFRFASFLKMWGIQNLREEDNERQHSSDGKSYPSLTERVARTLGHSLLINADDRNVLEIPGFEHLLTTHGLSLQQMLVTRINEATGKDGRKYHFITLTSPDGLEVESISHLLQISPLNPLPVGKRHYVNIGQMYDVLIRSKSDTSAQNKTVTEAFLSLQKPMDVFPTAIGYVEAIDTSHGHMHIYDSHSRHFVAKVQRFSHERVGDFVRFIPMIPKTSLFKSAIVLDTIPSTTDDVRSILRDIRITNVNREKGYASWQLVDANHPVTELLSPLQLSQGVESPSFNSGFLNLSAVAPVVIEMGQTMKALIYLKRGKDKQKRPYVAKLFLPQIVH